MPRALKLFLQGLTLFLLLSCGCCGLLFNVVDFDLGEGGGPSGPDFGRQPEGPKDLGTVVIPEGHPAEGARRFPWEAFTLTPRDHVVGYKLGARQMTALAADHLGFGRELNYRRVGEDLMVFDGPDQCIQHLGCVYDHLEVSNRDSVLPIAQKFVDETRARGLSAKDGAELIVTFVQSIEYRLPKVEPFGILPPALVLAQGWGDCDSKALLAVMMLHEIGVDAVVLTSAMFKHAAVGVGLPGKDDRFRGGGRSWQYVEITAKGWPIGMVPPEVDMPQFWHVVPMVQGPVQAADPGAYEG